MPPIIRVLLVEPQPLIEIAIRSLLASTDDLRLIDASLPSHHHTSYEDDAPYDVMLVGVTGDEAGALVHDLKQQFPTLRLILLAEETEDIVHSRLLEIGVAGCLLKRQISKSLIHAIRAVAEGESWFNRTVLLTLVEEARKPPAPAKPPTLTEREWQVLELLAKGFDNSAIATPLNLAEQTIRNKLTQIYEKLGVHTRAEAMIWFNRYGLD